MAPRSLRNPWVDALRALALLGVFVVNAVGYAQAPDYPQPVGGPLPTGAPLALVLHGLLLALVQGKAWSVLCFLFGFSLGDMALRLRATGLNVRLGLRARYRTLLLVGVVHGALLYFGDILTMYALCGWLAARWATARPARLLQIWLRITVLVTATMLVLGGSLWLAPYAPNDAQPMADALIHAPTLSAFMAVNAAAYLWAQVGSVLFFLPMLLWLTVAGMLARRFGLLGQRRYARQFWRRHLGTQHLVLGLALNLDLALATVRLHALGQADTTRLGLYTVLMGLPGIWLAAAAIGYCMRYQHRYPTPPGWVAWLAPAGQHTLAMYLLLSLALVLGRTALQGLDGATAPSLALAMAAWWLAVCAARWATRHRLRDPVSRWLSQRTNPASLNRY
ncbi:hypothetical protein [Rhodoferax sp.]|uniref:hypothetical protein n=1 Tax=Rhodoferax sp. TaxID=50421 RepID=UPI0025CCD4F0|nr:hypothetical protein [Rhodoferax sp.]